MVVLKREIVLFMVDRLPIGVIPIYKDKIKFLMNSLSEDAGYLYSNNHQLVYNINNISRSVTDLLETELSQKARLTESPILKVDVGTANLKQAVLTIYQSTNHELKGKAGVEVELKEGFTYEDIPWLPTFCIPNAYNEFEVLKQLFEELDKIHKDNLKEKQQKEQQILGISTTIEDSYNHDEEKCCTDEDNDFYEHTEDNKVYTVETAYGETIMATNERKQALLYGEEKLAHNEVIYVKTWVNGRHIKTITLSEG